jgi:CDP-diglyceride synthetase
MEGSNVIQLVILGERTHSHHYFAYIWSVCPIQIHALALAFCASVVAPFGGFLASVIKCSHGIKDFDSIILGHGGIMDHVDCQFLIYQQWTKAK